MPDKYLVKTPREDYYVEADSSNKARKLIMEREYIQLEKVDDEEKGNWIYLEQDDPRWSEVRIGNTTLGKDGCLVTDLSMLSYWYGKYFTPKEIAEKAGFTKNGYYIWKSGDDFLPFEFVWRYYNRDGKKIKDILYSKDNAVIVRATKRFTHWLVVIGFDDKNDQFIGADPLTGEPVYIENRYGLIDGFAEVKRK